MKKIYFALTIIFCLVIQSGYCSEKKEGVMFNLEFEKVIDGLEFPEGPAWDGKETLYFSDCTGMAIYKVTPKGAGVFLKGSTDPFTFEKTNGLTVSSDGYIYACEYSKGAILKISPQGKVETFVSEFEGKPFNRPNDLIFDSKGNLYFTDPFKYKKENAGGRVFRVEKETKKVSLVAEDLCFSNGVVVSPDGKNLFVCESAQSRVLKYKIEGDGYLSGKEIFAEMPGGDPDGMNFDIEGNLWVAHFGGGHIWVFKPNGELLQKIPTPGKKPSNVEFAGPDLKTLYVTEDETQAVYKAEVPIAGQPLF